MVEPCFTLANFYTCCDFTKLRIFVKSFNSKTSQFQKAFDEGTLVNHVLFKEVVLWKSYSRKNFLGWGYFERDWSADGGTDQVEGRQETVGETGRGAGVFMFELTSEALMCYV